MPDYDLQSGLPYPESLTIARDVVGGPWRPVPWILFGDKGRASPTPTIRRHAIRQRIVRGRLALPSSAITDD
jgi:hypothetical protein